MFNSLSSEVGTQASRVMGLSSRLADMLEAPFRAASYVWRLRFGRMPTVMHYQRGLPQGMAGSVLLAECAIAPLIWRVHHALGGKMGTLTVAYVDDINFVVSAESDLERLVKLLWDYTGHFGLELSMTKTRIWSSSEDAAGRLSEKFGFPATNVLEALGVQWPTLKSALPTFPKEMKRVREADRRLTRIRNMPVPLSTKVDLIPISALSLLDYVGTPTPEPALALRSSVKAALGNKFAAPEILFHVSCNTTIDPFGRWLISSLKLWHTCMNTCHDITQLEAILGGSKGRLACTAKRAEKVGIVVTAEGFIWEGKWVPASEPWYVLKKVLRAHLRGLALHKLSERRPTTYGGLTEIHVAQHRKLLASLKPLEQATIMKVWTEAVMTRDKSARLGRSEPECECGFHTQTLEHVIRDCPLTCQVPESLRYFPSLPPARSVAHLLKQGSDARDIRDWKAACVRTIQAIHDLNAREKGRGDLLGRIRRDRDWQGHVLSLSPDSMYAFCVKCFISRRIRDMACITTRRCCREDDESDYVGADREIVGHRCALEMGTWKNASQRPMWVCQRCRATRWATATFKRECPDTGP